MSGGFSFKKSEFNRATATARSAFKPFIYALALENGYSPSTLILDAPLVLKQGTDLKCGNLKIMVKNFMVVQH